MPTTMLLYGLDTMPIGRHEAPDFKPGEWPTVVRWHGRVFVAQDEPTPMGWIRYDEEPEYRINDLAIRFAPGLGK